MELSSCLDETIEKKTANKDRRPVKCQYSTKEKYSVSVVFGEVLWSEG